jgi:hypothetical protein
VLSGDRLDAAPSRHALVDLDDVLIGRGVAAAWHRAGRSLRLDVPDVRSSEQHARLRPTLGRWQLVDLESKNGVLVNGVRTAQSFLADGDLIEIGRTWFQFVAEIETPEGEPLDAVPSEPLASSRASSATKVWRTRRASPATFAALVEQAKLFAFTHDLDPVAARRCASPASSGWKRRSRGCVPPSGRRHSARSTRASSRKGSSSTARPVVAATASSTRRGRPA